MRVIPCAVGIDLGSTTSKAVILDENLHVLGQGITNSRSNYDVASAVARNEAEVDARMRLLSEELAGGRGGQGELAGLTPLVERAFRESQHLEGLRRLETACQSSLAHEAYSRWRDALKTVLAEIAIEMRRETPERFRQQPAGESNFFRDLASSAFMQHATLRADRTRLPFEVLMGIFDKSILEVESSIVEASFDERFMLVLERVLAEHGVPAPTRHEVARITSELGAVRLDAIALVGTGYGRARLPFARECIRSEILCHGLGAHVMFPATATVLDIGGQDTKAMQVDEQGIVTSFHMNDRCAAGCGRFLGYIADEMNLGLHELGPLAIKAERSVKINSTCTVFAGAELRERLSIGQRREDILAGLHRAIILRALSLLARAGGVRSQFTFTGGVARNEAAVKALMDLILENYGIAAINISPNSIYTGALGAAHFAWRTHRGGHSAKEQAA